MDRGKGSLPSCRMTSKWSVNSDESKVLSGKMKGENINEKKEKH